MNEQQPSAAAMRAAERIILSLRGDRIQPEIDAAARAIDAEFADAVEALECIAEETDDSVAFGLAAAALSRVRGG